MNEVLIPVLTGVLDCSSLARTLDIKGLSVTDTQVREIKRLFDNLLDFDKKPVSYSPRAFKPARGRFARSTMANITSSGAEITKRIKVESEDPNDCKLCMSPK